MYVCTFYGFYFCINVYYLLPTETQTEYYLEIWIISHCQYFIFPILAVECLSLSLCVLQESQAIPLVSVSQVLGEVHPSRGLRRQASQTEDPSAEKTDAGTDTHTPALCILHQAFNTYVLYVSTILHLLFKLHVLICTIESCSRHINR